MFEAECIIHPLLGSSFFYSPGVSVCLCLLKKSRELRTIAQGRVEHVLVKGGVYPVKNESGERKEMPQRTLCPIERPNGTATIVQHGFHQEGRVFTEMIVGGVCLPQIPKTRSQRLLAGEVNFFLKRSTHMSILFMEY
ncbi:unnamed protein product [Cyprideis torosa]|uniref:Uncharacterized protein n=1 Tax=Cyprideis torosa TaxID=163714 RepID=A0A7R8WL07_9CRUS|nr:unnamed protein product [Cyprideis torosa]CAG0897671.1 unnamed protein product [Cyprideis torosa]